MVDMQETIAASVLPNMDQVSIVYDEYNRNIRYPVGSILSTEEVEERCLVLERGGLERYYSFLISEMQEILVHEALLEADFAFVIPHEYLKIIVPDRRAEIDRPATKSDPSRMCN
jgi:hypothetical protein